MPLILACDGGSPNFGVSVIELSGGRRRVIKNGILKTTLKDMNDLPKRLDEMIAEIKKDWLQSKTPDYIICERYQNRGLKGSLIERVAFMYIRLHCAFPTAQFTLIMASTWKNQFHRTNTENKLDYWYKVARVTPHQLDSTLIGLYQTFLLDKSTPYQFDMRLLIPKIEKTSVEKLINRKVKL